MVKHILGLDLGTNSIGWVLLAMIDDELNNIVDMGCRIFSRSVEDKTPTPKNAKRRKSRLLRRVIQRRARRKQRLLNYLCKIGMLPRELVNHTQPEILLNDLGDPYALRAKALVSPLTPYELGRVWLHFVQRRGFLSSRKSLLGDMIDDPDVLAILGELDVEDGISTERAKEETAFKKDISLLRQAILDAGKRTLGEYLASLEPHQCKRNRLHSGGHLRTDRQMYREELDLIWNTQVGFHPTLLTPEIKAAIEEIIFYQRPLKLRPDRIGKCSLEPKRNRCRIARLEYQIFRYLQDINNLRYYDPDYEKELELSPEDKSKLITLFDQNATVSFAQIRKTLGLDKARVFNLEQGGKKLKGNITACEIRAVLDAWDTFSREKQLQLVEDLLTIKKKSVLKNRLVNHWQLAPDMAVKLCLLEFEPGHGNHSVKAINRLLPYLRNGERYDQARVNAGYGYAPVVQQKIKRLGPPPALPNPIVSRTLYELRRLINAIISQHGTLSGIRIEMARDLEQNTKRYQEKEKQRKNNEKLNDEAVEKYRELAQKNPHLMLSKYPSRDDKIKYRLWKDQHERCAYSGQQIPASILFGPEIDVDHIIPISESLDDSYMNKVVCYAAKNRAKGQRTPIEAFSGDEWDQIIQSIHTWDKRLKGKRDRFFLRHEDVLKRDFFNSQLNDTRYICREAKDYIANICDDVIVSKGITTAWLRHQWNLNSLVSETDQKQRTDHRHHTIDAAVIACVDRKLYQSMVNLAKTLERSRPEVTLRDIPIPPPWPTWREDLRVKIDNLVISHSSQRKLSGELHEETGAGFREGVGTIYRNKLSDFCSDIKSKEKAAKVLPAIIDPVVREIVSKHLEQHDYNPKEAFADGITVRHKDGKTPIKRVRVIQSKSIKTEKKLALNKFGIKDRQGKIFKWYSYGNMHHIEILRDTETNTYSGELVTMLEASHRIRGIHGAKRPVVNTNHDGKELAMVIYKRDMVTLNQSGERKYFVVTKLGQMGGSPRPTLVPHNQAISEKNATISDSIDALMTKYQMELHRVNIIGRQLE